MKKLTAYRIKKLAAQHGQQPCKAQLDLFKELFPDGAEITLENCRRAMDGGMNVTWLLRNCLPPPAWEAYEAARVRAWMALQKATVPTGAVYVSVRDQGWIAYEEAKAQALYDALTSEDAQ